MAQMGFPKHYTSQTLAPIVSRLYGDSLHFAVLYGSQKPKSDIDLFIVSNNTSRNYYTGWLDIYELHKDDFLHQLTHLDMSVLDPLFSGTLIMGDTDLFTQSKQFFHSKAIDSSVIDYYISEISQLSSFQSLDSITEKNRCSYLESFKKNLNLLQQGKKISTYNELSSLYK
jgi:hypothetical protein